MFIEFHPALAEISAWTNMFALDQTVTWAEKILRPVIVYIALVVMLRVFGKRELAQLNPFDLVVILSLSNTVQNAIIGEDNSLIGGVVGAVALLSINFAFSHLKYSSRPLEALTEGVPVKLVADGKTPKDTRTDAQKLSLHNLLVQLKKSYPAATIHGHRDFAAKACLSFDATKEYYNL